MSIGARRASGDKTIAHGLANTCALAARRREHHDSRERWRLGVRGQVSSRDIGVGASWPNRFDGCIERAEVGRRDPQDGLAPMASHMSALMGRLERIGGLSVAGARAVPSQIG